MKRYLMIASLVAAVGLTGFSRADGPPDAIVVRGQTEPTEKVDVPSVLRGQIAEIIAKEGQTVKKGDPIAKLDDALQQQIVTLARMDADSTVKIRKAEADLDYAKNELDRMVKLGAGASQYERREKELAVKQAELAVEQEKETAAQKRVAQAKEEVTLSRMTMKSPLDGTILRFSKHAGESIDETQTLATIVNAAKLNAIFYPPRTLFGKIHVNDHVKIDLATDPPISRDAVVEVVDPTIDPAAQLFRVKMEIDNSDLKIPAGSGATWTWNGPVAMDK